MFHFLSQNDMYLRKLEKRHKLEMRHKLARAREETQVRDEMCILLAYRYKLLLNGNKIDLMLTSFSFRLLMMKHGIYTQDVYLEKELWCTLFRHLLQATTPMECSAFYGEWCITMVSSSIHFHFCRKHANVYICTSGSAYSHVTKESNSRFFLSRSKAEERR